MQDDLIDLRHRSANGILDVYSPMSVSGKRTGDAKLRLNDYLRETLDWSKGHGAPHSADEAVLGYRILDTFLGTLRNGVLGALVDHVLSNGQTLRILLLDPFTPIGSARSLSLSGSTRDRGHRALQELHDLCANHQGHEPLEGGGEQVAVRDIALAIRSMVGDQVQVRFHSEITSGISYFFHDVLIRGTTFAGRDSADGLWDRIVNDPARQEDRYDQYSVEFEEIWANRSTGLPGERAGDPNGVFISYRHAYREYAEQIHGALTEVEPLADGTFKQLHVEMGEQEAAQDEGVFVDSEDLVVGDWWKEIIKATLLDKGSIVVLITIEGLSPWMLLEVGHFWVANKRIIPIMLDPDGVLTEARREATETGGEWIPPLPSALRDVQYTWWDGTDGDVVTQVRSAILANARAHTRSES